MLPVVLFIKTYNFNATRCSLYKNFLEFFCNFTASNFFKIYNFFQCDTYFCTFTFNYYYNIIFNFIINNNNNNNNNNFHIVLFSIKYVLLK